MSYPEQPNPYRPDSQEVNPYSSTQYGSIQDISQKTTIPGIMLVVVGSIGLLVMGIYFLLTMVGLSMQGPGGMQPPPDIDSDAERIGLYGSMVLMALSTFLQIFVILGGVAFIRQRGRGMAMAGSIISLIPCMSSCCIVGVPFGIWGLVVLMDPVVRQNFR